MKKLQQMVVALVTVVTPLALSSGVSAATGTCQNGFTGPDSNNICTSTMTYECTINDNNTVTITNDNTQVALSGDASSGGNGEGGGAQTGSATNSNGVTYTVTVANPETCTATATMPATPVPTPPQTPSAPAKQQVTPPKTTTPRTLAYTSGNTTLDYVIALIVGLGAVAVIARVATFAYSRLKS